MNLTEIFMSLTLDELDLIRLCINVAYESQIHGTHTSQLTLEQRTQLIVLRSKLGKADANG